jgi:nucleoside-diphosphate-sugar epimerase
MKTIIITGAAGLVGQNLVPRLKARGYRIIGIDKHPTNTACLRHLHPDIDVIEANLSEPGVWISAFAGAEAVVINQAQIGGLDRSEFVANNVTATECIIEAIRIHHIPFFVHISSSVVNSEAQDFYVETKTAQERFIDTVTEIPHVVLRPTLMFGWFDRKHLGWLRRFMEKTPVFPVPGSGEFRRQPLYAGDFAEIIVASIEGRMTGAFDISGRAEINYIDIIRLMKKTTGAKAHIVKIPYKLFYALLWLYAKFDSNPPFTVNQLQALVIPEVFPVIDWPKNFGVTETPLYKAFEETYLDPRYSKIELYF